MTRALAALQRQFIDAIDADGGAPWPGIEIYRVTARANVSAGLAQTYPVVRRLVGDEFFFEVARKYAQAHPSTCGDLNEYGADLAPFLSAYQYAAGLPYLPGVARLEWACHESARAADAAPLDFAALARVPVNAFSNLRFSLHPAVRLVSSRRPIAAIWHANQPERDGTCDLAGGAQCVVVSRAPGTAVVRAVDADEWRFLAALANGATLGEATEPLEEAAAARVLGDGLARFVTDGVIAAFALSA